LADFKYLIVGGGMTADSAVKGIRQSDATGKVGIICAEPHPPYNRPPLSKSLWKGDPLDGIWRKTPPGNIEILTGKRVVGLDVAGKRALEAGGKSYSYEKLLLATGGRPRRLQQAPEGVIYYRTLDDYLKLRDLCAGGKSFAVVGGGFIGSEIAAALAVNGKSVTMVVPQETIGGRVYPLPLGKFLNEYYRERGVEVLTRETVAGVTRSGPGYTVRTSGGVTREVDGVVAGLGIEPETGLARSSGLAVDNGIRVDEFLRTTVPGIFAAGDVANFFNPALGLNIRVEHEDNANTMGETAGRNLAGEQVPYNHLPFFYSDLFDLGYEAVGELDAGQETVADWKEEFREGVVYYLKEKRVRGVLLWNTWGKVDAARGLIADGRTRTREDLIGLIRS
jgi:3-phenylpropionate/trans-cinnamate dioxygenase ferredoxin reductase component